MAMTLLHFCRLFATLTYSFVIGIRKWYKTSWRYLRWTRRRLSRMWWLFPQWSAWGLQAVIKCYSKRYIALLTAKVFDVAKIPWSMAFFPLNIQVFSFIFAGQKVAIKHVAVIPLQSTRKSYPNPSIHGHTPSHGFANFWNKPVGEKLSKPLENEPWNR